MSYTFTHVKRYKRGAKWGDGETRTCTTCRAEKKEGHRKRAKQAVVTANMRYVNSRYKVPVAYCEDHIPDRLKEVNS